MGKIFIEKLKKVYLSGLFSAPIFVSEMINKRYYLTGKVKIAITLILTVGSITVNWGQTLWPGDVNNNGEVNGVDVLYWAYAKTIIEDGGPGRMRSDQDQTGEFIEINLNGLTWDLNFPNGLDFAYADCNGDGMINDSDRDVIESNFLMQRPANVVPDNFEIGEEGQVPPVMFLPVTGLEVVPQDTRELPILLNLGDNQNPIDSFYGLSFAMPYNGEIVMDGQGNDFTVEFDMSSWIGSTPNDVKQFHFADADNDVLHVVLYRQKTPIEEPGSGRVASIVMEDIVFGSNTSIELTPTNTKIVVKNFEEPPVFPVGTIILTDRNTSSKEVHNDNRVFMYPNPASGSVWLETQSENSEIEGVELYNILGRLAQRKTLDFPSKQLRLTFDALPEGLYLVKVKTSKGYFTGKLKIQK